MALTQDDLAAFTRTVSFMQATVEAGGVAPDDAAALTRVAAILQALIDTAPVDAPVSPQHRRAIVWGAKVSETFRDRVWWICDTLGFDPDNLMTCMAWESGRTFSASVRNMAGSGAVGLIQFMPSTAVGLGTTAGALASMTAEDQLRYVYKYLRPWGGRINDLADMYMTILFPKAVGKPDDYALFTGGVAYRENSGLDVNRDGEVTKAEAAAKLYALKAEGARFAA
jgi:hypothetical protein